VVRLSAQGTESGDHEMITGDAADCAWAPRHVPGGDHSGRCVHCGWPIPMPWWMPSTLTPAQTVGKVANRWGLSIPGWQAEAIAEKLLRWADQKCEVRDADIREAWEIEHYRASTRRRMRRRLIEAVTDAGMLPVALPSEALRYLDGALPGNEVPPDRVAHGAPWNYVEVTLAVPCRKADQRP
jgi:hypothetical protein